MTSTGIPVGLSWAAAAAGNWIPGLRPLEPFPAFNFAAELEGLLVGGFTQISGLEATLATESYAEGGVNSYTHQLPARAQYANLVLHHGLTASSALWSWFDDTVKGRICRRNGTIVMLNRQQMPIMWWNFRNALPVRWSGPTFDAGSDAVAFEAIELAHEGLSMPLLGQAAAAAHGVVGMTGGGA